MAYKGEIAIVPMGLGGLRTDDPESDIPATSKVSALNATFHNNFAEKDFGSIQWNPTALPSPILHAQDWFPTPIIQRLIAVTADGKVTRFKDAFNTSEVTAVSPAPATLTVPGSVTTTLGGQEETLRDRKLFIFTGTDPVQVISGDGLTRRNISQPPADWAGSSQPTSSVIHLGRHMAWGNQNDPHRVYVSSALDHEDFLTLPLSFSVHPGEAEGIRLGIVFRSRLFIVKEPRGLYFLDAPSVIEATWSFKKLSDIFGTNSPRSAALVLNDVMIGNEYGSITSLKASDTFGDIDSADIFSALKVQQFARDEISKQGAGERCAIYYPDKKTLMMTFRSLSGDSNDRISQISFKEPNNPTVSWNTKDQANCLALQRDESGVERPIYGSNDGFIYRMDSVNRWVGDLGAVQNGYRFEVETPAMDFGQADPSIAELNKIYDFLEVVFEPTGDWPLFIDVFIDARFHNTMKFQMNWKSELDEFKLDSDRIDSETEFPRRQPLYGLGRRIGFRCYNDVAGQNIKLHSLKIYWRRSGQQQRDN